MSNLCFVLLVNLVTALPTATFAPTGLTTAPAANTHQTERSRESMLFGKKWMLTEVDRVAVKTTKPYLQFDRQAKRFTGDSGCNRMSGAFELSGTNIRFSAVISTKRACLDTADQQIETNFLRRIEQTTRFQIQDDILIFFAGDTNVLSFKSDNAGGGSQVARVTGTVTYRQRIALSPSAVIEVKLLDVSRTDSRARTIAKQLIRPAGQQVPIEFAVEYDPRHINKRHRYSIQARILQNNKPRFVSTQQYLVITGGRPDTVNVIVKPLGR